MTTSILCGICAILVGAMVFWIYESIKAAKDPEVQVANKLRMSITRYRKYQKLYDAHWDVMMKFGVNSSEAEKFFAKEVYPNIPNLNEWRRYEDYRGTLQRKEQEEEIHKILSRENRTQQWKPTSIHDAFGIQKNQGNK